MRIVRHIIAAAAIAAPAASAASAEPLRICYEEWSPFASAANGRAAGLMIELVDRALAAAGRSAAYSQQPYLRCVGNVRSGAFDAILMSSDEAGLVPAGVSVAFWEVGVIARPDWPAAGLGSLRDLDGATVGLVGAYEYHPAIRAAAAGWRVHHGTDALFNLRMTASARIDATVADIPWARIEAAREHLPIRVLEPTLLAIPQYVYFHPDRAQAAAELGSALRVLLDDGTVDRVYRRATGSSFGDVGARAATALIRD